MCAHECVCVYMCLQVCLCVSVCVCMSECMGECVCVLGVGSSDLPMNPSVLQLTPSE